jgi:hypothetical protein
MMTIRISSHQKKSFLILRTWRDQVNRVSIATDGPDEERYISGEYWQQISPHWERECQKYGWPHDSSQQGVRTAIEFDSAEPYVILSGLFEAITCPIGLGSKIVSQKQKDQLISCLIEVWFADKLYETADLALKHDQLGQRWIDALRVLSTKGYSHRPSFVSAAMTPWLADRIREKTFFNRGEGSANHYFRWLTHEGKGGLSVFATHFVMGDERAYAIGPIISTRAQDFGPIRKPPKVEEQQALDFLLHLCGADAEAVRFEQPNRELNLQSALRAILFAARSNTSPAHFELPPTGSLFAA